VPAASLKKHASMSMLLRTGPDSIQNHACFQNFAIWREWRAGVSPIFLFHFLFLFSMLCGGTFSCCT
jgi:hypothetical protein